MKDRLYRARIGRVLGGVAAGLAKYLNLDPILVRVILIIVALLNGIGIILYIILWIIIPEEPIEQAFNMGPSSNEKDKTPGQRQDEKFNEFEKQFAGKTGGNGRTVVGIVLIGLGIIFLLENLIPYFEFEDLLPLALIGIGVALLFHSFKK
ncbi:MAG: PspC domain-containing protein [Melioribacteraceae bacterium]|nr:PspC domain-containing protein [Melioribacteraceae bacterium]